MVQCVAIIIDRLVLNNAFIEFVISQNRFEKREKKAKAYEVKRKERQSEVTFLLMA